MLRGRERATVQWHSGGKGLAVCLDQCILGLTDGDRKGREAQQMTEQDGEKLSESKSYVTTS